MSAGLLRSFFQNRDVEQDVAVHQNGARRELVFGAKNGEQLARTLVLIVVVIADVRQRDRFFLVSADERDFLDIAVVECGDLPFQDRLALDVEQTLWLVLDQWQQLLLEPGGRDDGGNLSAADG